MLVLLPGAMDSVASRLVAVGNNAFQQEETKVLFIDFTWIFWWKLWSFYVRTVSSSLSLGGSALQEVGSLWSHRGDATAEIFATSETRRLGQVNFRKDFWDGYWGQRKNWPIADCHVPGNDPRNNCGTHFGSSSLLVTKVAFRPPFKRFREYSKSPGYLKEGKLGWSWREGTASEFRQRSSKIYHLAVRVLKLTLNLVIFTS